MSATNIKDNLEPLNGKQKRILCVDDDQANCLLIQRMLKNQYEVISANSGNEAFEMLEKNEIDLILLDVVMPDMNGFDVCRAIRGSAEGQDIPIIFLTAREDPEDVKNGLEIGGSDYIKKPFHRIELQARIATQLRLAEALNLSIRFENLRAVRALMVSLNHELRNPLSTISSAMGLLEPATPKDVETHQIIKDSIKQVIGVIDQINELDEIVTHEFRNDPNGLMLRLQEQKLKSDKD